MRKLNVDICLGTTCHVFGASDLLRVEDLLSEEQKAKVEIRGVPCLGACRDDNFGGAPFVRIGGTTLSKATVNAVADEIERLLGSVKP